MQGSGCIDPYFLDLCTSWRWVVSFTPRALYPRERAPGTPCIGGWVDPRAGLDDMEEWKFLTLPGLEPRPLSRPARSQSLYRLRYPGSPYCLVCIKLFYSSCIHQPSVASYIMLRLIKPSSDIWLFTFICVRMLGGWPANIGILADEYSSM
jgi:hypothetical protein